ncbi:hypothetical protein [Flavobacterium sp. NKUCC04_CG]|uniref:hypothetical protein n=1 Tax=Flavobacterium sp. NKUCC04_CG TaxID=2842121 RepID=UPI001C5AD655|nr:hypothetical protein [Flavobacterium sp. NKUCC04_CG]MBW3519503.1 hypothetical protein [Flavobacterium sp. NKUCC04_CG]
MKEAFDSVFDSVKTRFTNPFLATFLGVWIIRNWYLVYAFFIFDAECTMDDKINYFKTYFKNYDILKEFLINSKWTFIILLVTFSLLLISHILQNCYSFLIRKSSEIQDRIPVSTNDYHKKLILNFKILTKQIKEINASNENLLVNEQTQIVKIGELENEVLGKVNESTLLSNDIDKLKDIILNLENKSEELNKQKESVLDRRKRDLSFILRLENLENLYNDKNSRHYVSYSIQIYKKEVDDYVYERFIYKSIMNLPKSDYFEKFFNESFSQIREENTISLADVLNILNNKIRTLDLPEDEKEEIKNHIVKLEYIGLFTGLFKDINYDKKPVLTDEGKEILRRFSSYR